MLQNVSFTHPLEGNFLPGHTLLIELEHMKIVYMQVNIILTCLCTSYISHGIIMPRNMTVPQLFHGITMGHTGQNSTILMRVPQSHNTATMGQSHGIATMGISDHESITTT